MNRSDFQALAGVGLAEANALLSAGHYDGAYYLAGYAVECALKACIAKLTREFDFPPDRRFIEAVYTHDLERLVVAAGLGDQLRSDMASDSYLEANWSTVKEWSEQSRYSGYTEEQAISLYTAIAELQHGVFAWLLPHW